MNDDSELQNSSRDRIYDVEQPKAELSNEENEMNSSQKREMSASHSSPVKKPRRSKWDTDIGTVPPTTDMGSELDKPKFTVYVKNIPTLPEAVISQFFDGALLTVAGKDITHLTTDPDQKPVLSVTMHSFGAALQWCEVGLRSKEDKEALLELSGIQLSDKTMTIIDADDDDADEILHQETLLDDKENEVEESKPPHLIASDMPLEMSESEVRGMFESFGTISHFEIMRDQQTGDFCGGAVCQFDDHSVTDVAVQALHGSITRGRVIKVVTSTMGHMIQPIALPPPKTSSSVTSLPTSVTSKIYSNPIVAAQVNSARQVGDIPSQVVQLLNVVFQEDLICDSEYESIVEDVKQQASKYGTLDSIIIPRPAADMTYRAGVGKVFLHYADLTSARKARLELNGRRYDGRRVVCAAFYPLTKFLAQEYTLS